MRRACCVLQMGDLLPLILRLLGEPAFRLKIRIMGFVLLEIYLLAETIDQCID